MGKIYFYDNLVALAKSLIEAKSTYDDVKAGQDKGEIEALENSDIQAQKTIDAAKKLHKRLNDEYKEIAQMHIAASQIKSVMGINNGSGQSEYEKVMGDLEADRYGIYTSILLKHKAISCIKDFIKRVE